MKSQGKIMRLTVMGLVIALTLLFIVDANTVTARAETVAITATSDGNDRYTVDLAAAGGANDIVVTFEMDVVPSGGDHPVNIIINNNSAAKYKFNRYVLTIEPEVEPSDSQEPGGYPRRFAFYEQNNYPGFGFDTFNEYSSKGDDPDFIREYLLEFIDENGAAFAFNNTLGATPGNPYGAYLYTVTLEIHLEKNELFTVSYDGNTNTEGIAPDDTDNPYSIGESVTVLYKGTLEKTDHEFLGWNTDKNAAEAQYVPGDPAKGTFTMPSDNVVLYAVWRNTALSPKYPYTIRYYKDSLSAGNEIFPAETSAAKYDENHLLTADEINNDFPGWLNLRKPATGYQDGTLQSALPLTITATEADNVVNVVYVAITGGGGGTTLAPLDNSGLVYEIIDDDGTPLGKWSWDEKIENWIYDEYPPLGASPQTGAANSIAPGLGVLMLAAGAALLLTDLRK